jgi:hypothetical protein
MSHQHWSFSFSEPYVEPMLGLLCTDIDFSAVGRLCGGPSKYCVVHVLCATEQDDCVGSVRTVPMVAVGVL